MSLDRESTYVNNTIKVILLTNKYTSTKEMKLPSITNQYYLNIKKYSTYLNLTSIL